MFDLKGLKFKIAVHSAHPFLFLDNNSIDGSEAKILETLSQYLNFSYELIDFSISKGQTGDPWTPLMNSIVTKQADFGIFNIFMTYSRSKLVPYSYPYIIDLVTFACPQPKIQTNDLNLIQPFETWIWITLVLNIILIIVLNLILFRNLINIRWIILSILMRQQFYVVSKVRLLLFCWLLAGIVLTSSYAGVIYSITATPLEVDRINSIYDLNSAQKLGKITVIGLSGGLHFKMIKNMKSGVSQEIGSAIIGVDNSMDAMDLLKTNKAYAFLLTKEKLFYLLYMSGVKSYYIPDNSNMDSVFAINFIGIPMNKEFLYKTHFNLFISNALKGGLIEYWKQRFYNKFYGNAMFYYNQNLVKSHHLKPLSIEQFNVIYLILLIGYLISALIVFIENLFSRYHNSKPVIP